MGKKSGGGSSTQKTSPYLKTETKSAAKAATALYNDGGGYYQGTRLADPSAETNTALNAIAAQANGGAGNGLNQSAVDQYLATIRGDFLNGNPYIDSVVNSTTQDITRNFTNSVLPQLNSTFATSGRYGSGLQEQAINDAINTTSQNVADTAGKLRYDNYNSERARQLQAASGASAINDAAYNDARALAGVGSARDALAQARLDDTIGQQELQRSILDDYIARITQLNGSGGTTITSQQSAGGGRLGGALSGAAAGGSIGGPYGAAAGAVLGFLGGK